MYKRYWYNNSCYLNQNIHHWKCPLLWEFRKFASKQIVLYIFYFYWCFQQRHGMEEIWIFFIRNQSVCIDLNCARLKTVPNRILRVYQTLFQTFYGIFYVVFFSRNFWLHLSNENDEIFLIWFHKDLHLPRMWRRVVSERAWLDLQFE